MADRRRPFRRPMRNTTATRSTPRARPTVTAWERADSAWSDTSPVSSRNLASMSSRVIRVGLWAHRASLGGLPVVRLWPRLTARTATAATATTTTAQIR